MGKANQADAEHSPTGRKRPGPARLRRSVRLIWPALALLLLLAFNLFKITDGHVAFTLEFFVPEVKDGRLYCSFIDVLNRAAPVLLTGLGMTLVIATGGVDLSVGAVVAIAGSVAALLLTRPETPWGLLPVVGAALGVCLLAGAWNGALVSVFGVQPIVATLVLMVAGRGIAKLLTGGQIITVENESFSFIAGGHFLMLPFTVTIVATMFVLTALLTRLTAARLFIESVGDNQSASRYAGVNVRLVKLLAYAFCGLCAGLAGLIAASNIKAADANNAGMYLELDAILAVVIGGTALTGGRFFLIGTLFGALIIQTLTTTILTRGVPVQYTLVVKALVVLAVCLLQSEALRSMLLRRRSRA